MSLLTSLCQIIFFFIGPISPCRCSIVDTVLPSPIYFILSYPTSKLSSLSTISPLSFLYPISDPTNFFYLFFLLLVFHYSFWWSFYFMFSFYFFLYWWLVDSLLYVATSSMLLFDYPLNFPQMFNFYCAYFSFVLGLLPRKLLWVASL